MGSRAGGAARRRRAAVCCAAFAAIAGLALACGEPPPRIVLLVSIDTLRPDHLGAYGYPRPTSPALDAVAKSGVLFEDAMSASPWTLPSHATLLTGLYPARHRLTDHALTLPDGVATLASTLAAAGFATRAAVNSHNLSERYGLTRGFEAFHYVREAAARREPYAEITERGVAWIESMPEGRLFVFLHYFDVHSDYASRPEYEARFARPYAGGVDGSTDQLRSVRAGERHLDAADVARLFDLYDAGIRQLDDEFARLLAALERLGVADETLLVVTSDHGEEFLEHGGVLHGRTQFQEVLRVPLLLRGPRVPSGVRVPAPVSLVDLMPTLLALADVPLPPALDGVDLAPLWRGSGAGRAERTLFAGADHNRAQHDITRSARRGRFKLHYNRATQEHALYDLERDPAERDDVAAEHEEVARELLAQLEARFDLAAPTSAADPLSEEEVERLKSLGYIE